MRNYELTLLLKTGLGESELQAFLGELTSLLQDAGALIMGQDFKGRRRLPAAIQKQQETELAVLKFALDPLKLAGIEQELRTKENILRFSLLSYAPRKAQERVIARTTSAPQITEEEKVELGDIDKKLQEIFKDDNL